MALNPNLKSMTAAKKVIGKAGTTGASKKPAKTVGTLNLNPFTNATPKTMPPPMGASALPIGGGAALRMPTVAPPVMPPRMSATGLNPADDRMATSLVAPANTGATNPGNAPAGSGGNSMPGGVGDGQKYDGWASGVRPGAVPGLIQNPEALLANVMAQMGISSQTNPGLYGMAAPFADYANALTLLGLGTTNENAGNNNAALNFMGDYFSNLLTRGANGSDYGAAVRAIKGAGSGTDTPLAAYLNIDDPAGQADAYKSLLMPAAASGLHPLFARALSDKLDMLKTQYVQRSAFGSPPGSFGGMLGSGSVFRGQ